MLNKYIYIRVLAGACQRITTVGRNLGIILRGIASLTHQGVDSSVSLTCSTTADLLIWASAWLGRSSSLGTDSSIFSPLLSGGIDGSSLVVSVRRLIGYEMLRYKIPIISFSYATLTTLDHSNRHVGGGLKIE